VVAKALIRPDELRRITEEKEMEQLREGREKKRKADEERHHLHDAFMTREIHPDVLKRVSTLVRGAAERGEREVLALRFRASSAPTADARSTTSSPTGPRP
jgi:hypothetical protein